MAYKDEALKHVNEGSTLAQHVAMAEMLKRLDWVMLRQYADKNLEDHPGDMRARHTARQIKIAQVASANMVDLVAGEDRAPVREGMARSLVALVGLWERGEKAKKTTADA